MQKGARIWLKWGLRLVGPAILIIFLIRLKNPGAVIALLKNASPLLLVGTFALNIVAIHLKTVRWQILLKTRGIEYRLKDAWLAFGASVYLGMMTPGRVGDVLRIQYLRHDKKAPYSEGLASVAMDRVYDLYVLIGFFSIGIIRYGSLLLPWLRWVGWAAAIGSVVGPLVLLVPGIAEKLFGAMYRRLSKDPDAGGLQTFLTSMRVQARRATVVTLPLTIVSFLTGFAQSWLVARGMGLDISYFDVACLTAMASVLSLLPISISGVGVREILFAAIFPSLGYTAEHGVGYGLMVFTVLYLGVAAIGFICWQIRPPPTAAAVPSAP